jgi:Ca-activated chloride channel homolog
MPVRRHQKLFFFFVLWLLPALACQLLAGNGGVPRNAIVVEVTASTSLESWLTAVTRVFNDRRESIDGRPVYVNVNFVESGRAAADMLAGGDPPALWLPEEPVWADIVAVGGQANFSADCRSVAESPLVIAMWRPLAESLGWPAVSLGWLDVGSLAADPAAWAYYSGGEYGDVLRLGHTHPGLSASGASTLLAIVHAAEGKTEAVSVAEIEQPIVQASVGAFEAAVSWFSPSTASLGETMRDRGAAYLGAAVMYENTVLEYGGGDPAIVPVYPFEGTFVATHPACLNPAAPAEVQRGAGLFRDYLLSEPAQQWAADSGLRPVTGQIDTALLQANGRVDLNEPQRVFAAPSVDTVYAVQDLWQAARKNVNLVMLLDISGSMRGSKMDGMRASAAEFVRHMADDDYLTIITFDTRPEVLVYHQQVGPVREEIVRSIRQLEARGWTALYDAIGDGAAVIAETQSPDTTNVLVILTDGMDTSSERYDIDQQLIDRVTTNQTTVFTIAYGSDADEELMADLARRANGNYYKGDEANIAAIYEEMSAAFGGAVGIGR